MSALNTANGIAKSDPVHGCKLGQAIKILYCDVDIACLVAQYGTTISLSHKKHEHHDADDRTGAHMPGATKI